jgi:hypothetical protein
MIPLRSRFGGKARFAVRPVSCLIAAASVSAAAYHFTAQEPQ